MLKNTLKLTEIYTFAYSFRSSQHKSTVLCSALLNKLTNIQQFRGKRDNGKNNDSSNLSSLFIPVPVKPNPDDINVGAELTGPVNKSDLLKILNKFYQKKEIKYLCAEYGLDQNLQHQAYIGFRKYCLDASVLPEDLHVVVSDILQGAGHVDDIFPYFLRFAKQMFPHLEYMDELKNESDLRTPAAWYPEARNLTRKIIFHAGPTNSGKTYHALERFMTSKSGVYCGPLKLLANEVFIKTNDRGIPCDLVTGEERKYVQGEGNEASHVSCTVEMTNFKARYDVAVIDEIQMMKDMGRGWAWTRALLGIIADEIHVCGEAGAIDLVQQICLTTNETVEVREYKRLTELAVEDKALGGLENVEPGDCIVCFSKNDIYSVSRTIEGLGKEVAVIYGGLPPGTKLAQAKKFNDVNHSCKILVATDAIGMGLNLSIRRVIFYSLIKPKLNEKGEKEMDTISVSSALQIAGRAGRYGTQWEKGFVTTYKPDDLSTLKHILSQFPEPITQAGLLPTANQIQTYSMYLPNATLSNIMDIFVGLSRLDDSLYFMCNIEDFKFLADLIQHVPLPLVVRYDFCCAPINKKMPFVCMMFTKFARQYSKNETITYSWLRRTIGWPLEAPKTLIDLVQLETVFDVLDLYLWLSYRFADLFPDANMVREMQQELDLIIQEGVFQLTRLVKNSEGAGIEPFGENWNTGRRKRHASKEPTSKSLSEELGVGKGRLTDRLLSQGLLTPAMLKELRKEWNENGDPGDPESPKGNNKPSGKGRRKRKF